MLAQEATRKITAVFFHLLAAPQSENQTLKAKVCQLEKTLKTTTENYEHARVWRENVLNGCPVLVEQTGMIFTLKPFGKCVPQADEGTAGNSEPSPAAGWTCGDDAGARLLKGVHHVSPENNSQEADAPVESTSPSRQGKKRVQASVRNDWSDYFTTPVFYRLKRDLQQNEQH